MSAAKPYGPFKLTPHARHESSRRGIPAEILADVLANPEQIVAAHSDRNVYQSMKRIRGIMFLVRVIVDERVSPAKVVTVYRTTKIRKYWSQS